MLMNIDDAGWLAVDVGKQSIFIAVFCGGVKTRLKDNTCWTIVNHSR